MGRDVRVAGRPAAAADGEKGDVEMTTNEGGDVASVETLAKKLGQWSNGIASVLVQLDDYIASIRASESVPRAHLPPHSFR